MKFATALLLLASYGTNAFVAPSKGVTSTNGKFGLSKPVTTSKGKLEMGTMADELDLPCTDVPSFPNLPPSVHPGVVSGQAMMDLLADAKEKGKRFVCYNCITSTSSFVKNLQ